MRASSLVMTGEPMSQCEFSEASGPAETDWPAMPVAAPPGMQPSRRHFLSSVMAVAGGASMMAMPDDVSAREQGKARMPISVPVPTLVAFGDSNTWGYVPRIEEGPTRYARYDQSVRWPMALERAGAGRFRVIEHGICGLVGGLTSGEAKFEDGASRAAIDHIRGVILANWPIAELVVMLGTNDLAYPNLSRPEVIAPKVAATVLAALESYKWMGGPMPAVTLVSPIPLGRRVIDLGIAADAISRSRQLAPALAEQASLNGWRFLDAGALGELETVDGIHWDASHHLRFADMLKHVVFA